MGNKVNTSSSGQAIALPIAQEQGKVRGAAAPKSSLLGRAAVGVAGAFKRLRKLIGYMAGGIVSLASRARPAPNASAIISPIFKEEMERKPSEDEQKCIALPDSGMGTLMVSQQFKNDCMRRWDISLNGKPLIDYGNQDEWAELSDSTKAKHIETGVRTLAAHVGPAEATLLTTALHQSMFAPFFTPFILGSDKLSSCRDNPAVLKNGSAGFPFNGGDQVKSMDVVVNASGITVNLVYSQTGGHMMVDHAPIALSDTSTIKCTASVKLSLPSDGPNDCVQREVVAGPHYEMKLTAATK